MTHTIKLLTAALLLPFLSHAQTGRRLPGTVTSTSGKPIANAAIALLRMPDSAVLYHTVANDSGQYILTAPVEDNTILKAEASGFAPGFSAWPGTALAEWNIILNEAKTLNEVTVSATKPVLEYKADRTVFNVENSIAAAGGDALEALRKAPGVTVMNNQVMLTGKNSVSIMLNGRMQQLSGEDLIQFLRNLQADNLSRIEIITTPPARYDAEGNTGIINLVTKKNLKNGIKGNVSTMYRRNSYHTPNVGGTLNYRYSRLNLSSMVYSGISSWKYTAHATTYFPGQRWDQQAERGNINRNLRPTAGLEYSLGKRSVVGAQFALATNRIENPETTTALAYNSSGVQDSVIKLHGNTSDLYRAKYSLNVNYECKFDSTGKKLTVDADYYTQVNEKTRYFEIANTGPDSTLQHHTNNRMTAIPDLIIRSVKADVECPLKEWRLSWGAKASNVINAANNIFETLQAGHYVIDKAQTNAFSYNEQIQAAYVGVQKKFGVFEVQAGLRGEHTHTTGYSSTLAQTTERDYTKLFPSAFVSYAGNADHAFSLSFNRRINRPSYSLLNPFRFYYTPTSYSEGNVNLQPSVSHLLELRYVLKSKYSFKITGNRGTDYWDRIFILDSAANTSKITTANMGNTWYLGTNINGSFSIGKWCDLSGSVNGSYSKFEPYMANAHSYDGFNASFDANCTIYLNKAKTIIAEANGYYYTPRQGDYKHWAEIYCINLGIRWMLLNKALVFTLNGNDILAKAYWLQTNMLNGTKEYSYDDERAVRFSATYKFGNNNLKGKRERANIDELQRVN